MLGRQSAEGFYEYSHWRKELVANNFSYIRNIVATLKKTICAETYHGVHKKWKN